MEVGVRVGPGVVQHIMPMGTVAAEVLIVESVPMKEDRVITCTGLKSRAANSTTAPGYLFTEQQHA